MMEKFKFVMITDFEDYWTKTFKKDSAASFPKSWFFIDFWAFKLPSKANVLFIERTKGTIKRWQGAVSKFRERNSKIYFDILELKPWEHPHENENDKVGVYALGHLERIYPESSFEPPLFAMMADCSFSEFEDHCYHLLRLLGIHNSHKIPADDQSGAADGFFKFEQLFVLYDATTKKDYLKKKGQQLNNYAAQLKSANINFEGYEYTIAEAERQVWVITRGKEVELIKRSDDILIKEIPYQCLIELYYQRILNNWNAKELFRRLVDL